MTEEMLNPNTPASEDTSASEPETDEATIAHQAAEDKLADEANEEETVDESSHYPDEPLEDDDLPIEEEEEEDDNGSIE